MTARITSASHQPGGPADPRLLVNQFFNLVYFGPLTNMEVVLTESCNLACDYCFVREKSPKTIREEDLRSAINFLVFYSGNRQRLNLTLFGGEPLLSRDRIFAAVDQCDQIESESGKTIKISMTTNGTLLDEEILRKTAGRINYLLSIDGGEQTHDRFRRYRDGRGSFRQVAGKIPLLRKYQPWLGARMTVTPETCAGLYENIKALHELGIGQILIGPAMDMTWDAASIGQYEAQLLQAGRYYLANRRSGRALRMTFFEEDQHHPSCQENMWGCGAGRNTISVGIDGSLFPCSKFAGYEGVHAGEVKLGSLDEGITNINLRKKMSRLTESAYAGCSTCTLKDACAGGCPADNFLLNRSLTKPGKAGCDLKAAEQRVLKKLRPELMKLNNA